MARHRRSDPSRPDVRPARDFFETPESLLPPQWQHHSAIPSERRLILAVLEDAVHCFRKYAFATDSQGRRLFQDADDWIHNGGHESPFSFENVCDALDLNPAYLRSGLKQWHRRARAQSPK